ncbi:MAG: hypothetical protein LBO82_05460 [Synergistaceae bacterium]|jgi:hypothetical protein|nr:hypothetical protein [Synergistaceae bacterium]
MSEIIRTAVIYSCIAFSIVFVVLGGLTVVIYAMRLTAGSNAPSAPASGTGKGIPAGPAASVPSSASSSSSLAVPAASANVKAHHVAAVAAAILAATQGRGRVLGIVPAQAQGQVCLSPANRWRSAAILENVGRHLSPAWRR